MKTYYIYIMASKRNGTIYIGVTDNLKKRVFQHKNGMFEGFTKKYRIHNLFFYEETIDIKVAIAREKQLKKWNRKWKTGLLEKNNPTWNDLAKDWFEE